MGCQFNFSRLKATTDDAAIKETRDLIDESRYENGHGGDSGTFAEAHGCVVNKKTFNTFSEAEDWLDENAEKRGPAVIVSTKEGYCVGANCAS